MTTATGSTLEYAIGTDGICSIRLRDGDLRMRAIDGETIRIREVNHRDLNAMFAVELGDGSVSLRSGGNAEHGGRGTPSLEIELPRHATVVVEAGSADIAADGLAGDQRYRTASGDMRLRAVSGHVAIDAVSGDVDIIATGETALTIRTVSGDVELRAVTITALEAATTSGDLRIAGRLAGKGPFSIVTVSGDALLAPAGDVRIEMATLSGDLRSTLDGRFEGGRGRRSLEVGVGGPLVSVRSMSGDLQVVPPTPMGAQPEPRPPVSHATTPGPAGQEPQATPDTAPMPAGPAASPAIVQAFDEARLRILRLLEDGEIDVAEAGRRLEALDEREPTDADGSAHSAGGAAAAEAVDPATDTTRYATAESGDA